ncbi:hypothetical protein NHQ30_000715 [Ciborinia camelliae]|nr:hypothetical protein NHQ30_000715 [Ciborinia camelliae]
MPSIASAARRKALRRIIPSDDESDSDDNSTKVFTIEGGDSAKRSNSNPENQSEQLQVATNAAAPESKIVVLRVDRIILQEFERSFSSHIFNQYPPDLDMPAYRTGGRRQNRTGYVDHDILEGIPVRQWRREFVTVAPPPPQESNASQNDIWASELPWGMPRDSHLLPQHSQDLLRAARSGRIYKRPAPMDEEEQDLEALGDKPDKKEDETKDSGFTARAWKQIPGHQNASDMDFLAKRRKGLVSAVPKPAPVPTVVQTTVRRTDAAGNEYLEKVIVPHGQTVVGDVVSQTTIPDPNAVEGTPFRRKGPVGKKGKRGPGRGRKKIIPTSTPHVTSEPAVQNGHPGTSNLGANEIKIESEGSTTPAKNLDAEMIDDSNPASDDDDGDEGDQGDEEDDFVDILNSPSRPHRGSSQDHLMSNMHDVPKLSSADVTMSDTDNYGPAKSELERVKDEGKFGSPLKQIALTTSTVNTPMVSPTETTIREPILFAQGDIPSAFIERINPEMLSITEVSAPTELPTVPPHPTEEHEEVSTELRAEEEEEEEMLLDILENAENVKIGASIPVEAESPAPAVLASVQSPTKALDPLPAEERSNQNVAVPFSIPSPVPAVEEPPTIPALATASSGSPIKEEEQLMASPSSLIAVHESAEPTESTKPAEQAAPNESNEHIAPIAPIESNEHIATTESNGPNEHIATPKSNEPNENTAITESNEHPAITESSEPNEHTAITESNKPNEPAEPANPIIEEEDDDFPDLLGGLERNLYGNSHPPAAPPAPALAAAAPVPEMSIEESKLSLKEAEGVTNTEEKENEKDGEVKEEVSTC